MVTVVNLRYQKYTIYGGRPGKGMEGPYGNPFIVGVHGERGECCKLFAEWFYSDDPKAVAMRERSLKEIGIDDTIGCFCKDRLGVGKCHCDTIADYINRTIPDERRTKDATGE